MTSIDDGYDYFSPGLGTQYPFLSDKDGFHEHIRFDCIATNCDHQDTLGHSGTVTIPRTPSEVIFAKTAEINVHGGLKYVAASNYQWKENVSTTAEAHPTHLWSNIAEVGGVFPRQKDRHWA